jgi:ubiquinone/menaquinone biosynthesis C-methylase UbiE
VHFSTIGGTDLKQFENDTFDLVYSYIVFQHIPEEAVIESYLREISRVLKPGGRAALQFDTRPEGALVKLYKSLPDSLLPRPHRRFIRRYRRRPERLQILMEGAGLTIADEQGRRTAEHFFLLKK